MKNIVDAILQIGRLVKVLVEQYDAVERPAANTGSANKPDSPAK